MELTLHLFGIDPASALTLTSGAAKRLGCSPAIGRHTGGWSVLKAPDDEAGNAFMKEAEALLYPKALFVQNPFAWAVAELARRQERITFAESCTGGLLAALFTRIPGCSAILEGSLVTYSNRLKTAWLGVGSDTLERYGAVSAPCVEEMLEGALLRTDADVALAISGIAGPDGGTPQKPVGTVFVGVMARANEPIVEALHLKGDRSQVQHQSAYHALRLLLTRHLQMR